MTLSSWIYLTGLIASLIWAILIVRELVDWKKSVYSPILPKNPLQNQLQQEPDNSLLCEDRISLDIDIELVGKENYK